MYLKNPNFSSQKKSKTPPKLPKSSLHSSPPTTLLAALVRAVREVVPNPKKNIIIP